MTRFTIPHKRGGTPTDDEREAARRLLNDVNPKHRQPPLSMLADDIRIVASAVLRHTEVPEPSGARPHEPNTTHDPLTGEHTCDHCGSDLTTVRAEQQGEPSDAQVAEIEQRVYDQNRGQVAGMAKALVRAGWDAAVGGQR